MEQEEKDKLLAEFYDTIDIATRKDLLHQYIAAAPEDAQNPLREALFTLRYTEKEDVDKFLWYYLNLPYVYKNAHSRFFKKSAKKEFDESIGALGFPLAQPYGEAGTQVLYREFVNASKRFFGVCAGDKSYNRKLLGLATITDQQTREKIAKDVHLLSAGLQEAFPEHSETLAPFAKANVDAFGALYQDAKQLLAAVQNK